MSAFSGQFDWRVGLVWRVGFIAGSALPDNSLVRLCDALVDTGASQTCIAKSAADELDLQPAGKTEMQTAGGLVATNVYDVQLAFIYPKKNPSDGIAVIGQAEVIGSIQAPEFVPGKNAPRASNA